mgnify:CR=1 FL=1
MTQVVPHSVTGVAFLIAFMGWMPAPIDISIWHSIWVLEKKNDLKNKFAIQGNLNPKILLESDEIIWSETQSICRLMQNYPGFIFNLGHGITPDINPGKVQVMIDAIRS